MTEGSEANRKKLLLELTTLDSFSVRGLVTAAGCFILAIIALVEFFIRRTWGLALGTVGFLAVSIVVAYISGVRVRRPGA
jgi:hypothetical protein